MLLPVTSISVQAVPVITCPDGSLWPASECPEQPVNSPTPLGWVIGPVVGGLLLSASFALLFVYVRRRTAKSRAVEKHVLQMRQNFASRQPAHHHSHQHNQNPLGQQQHGQLVNVAASSHRVNILRVHAEPSDNADNADNNANDRSASPVASVSQAEVSQITALDAHSTP